MQSSPPSSPGNIHNSAHFHHLPRRKDGGTNTMIELLKSTPRIDRFYSQTSHCRMGANGDDNNTNRTVANTAIIDDDDGKYNKATTAIHVRHKHTDDLVLERGGDDKEKEWKEQYFHDNNNTSTIVIKHKYSNDTQRIIAKPDVVMALRSSSGGGEEEGEDSNNIQQREQQNTLISHLPRSFQPYARLSRVDKPIGTLLLLYPCLWSTVLATSSSSTSSAVVPMMTDSTILAIITDSSSSPIASSTSTTVLLSTLSLCSLFTIGSFIMRSAGCTINDMWDYNYDKSVSRTKHRPLASGELTHREAFVYLGVQLSLGAGVLLSLPNVEQCFIWGVSALPLVVTYPLMKRYTDYPQLVLGATFNWGAIMGYVAVHGTVNWYVVGPLYTGCVAWTVIYDTLYAHQDKVDDAKIGLKSTALSFGEFGTKPILTACALVAWGGWSLAGYNAGLGNVLDMPYYYVGISAAGTHLLWQIYTADLNDVDNLSYRFRSNNVVGGIVLASCIAGNVMSG
jgi:4-hydroxybenzoate polyprenyltransferase